MTTDRVDVYIAVEHKDSAKTLQLFNNNDIHFEADDMCCPFSDDESLFVFYLRDVRQGDTDRETGLLLDNKVPFSLFHRAGSDFHYGWTHSRLQADGNMSFIQYFGDGESVFIQQMESLLDKATSLEEAKQLLKGISKEQSYPAW